MQERALAQGFGTGYFLVSVVIGWFVMDCPYAGSTLSRPRSVPAIAIAAPLRAYACHILPRETDPNLYRCVSLSRECIIRAYFIGVFMADFYASGGFPGDCAFTSRRKVSPDRQLFRKFLRPLIAKFIVVTDSPGQSITVRYCQSA